MEKWSLYSKKRELSNIIHTRGEKIPKDLYHLVVHVWIRNSEGKYLISRRSEDRPRYPLLWECVGGSVLYGEGSYDAAIRETIEEVGIDLSLSNGKVIKSIVRDDKQDIADIWLFEYDGEVDLSKATTKEVCDVKWMNHMEIVSLVKEDKMVPTLYYYFDMLEMKSFKTHEMNLNPEPFESIYNKEKDIEMRLYDEKRRMLSIGDIIVFINNKTFIKVKAVVTNLYIYNDYYELYKNFEKTRLGYKKNEVAHPSDMEEYYSKEKIEKYGVIGIEIKVLKN